MEIATAIIMNNITTMIVIVFEVDVVGMGSSASGFFSSVSDGVFDGDGFSSPPVGNVGVDGVGVCFG